MPADVLVILDEAYAEFVTDPDAVDGLRVLGGRSHPNVVVLRTFSKAYGLAGLRVGYAIGHPRILDAARSTGIPLSVTAQAEEAALASLDAEDELLERVRVDRRAPRPARRGAARDRLARARRRRATSCGCPRATRDRSRSAGASTTAGLIVRPFAGDGMRIIRRRSRICREGPTDRGIRCPNDLPEGHSGRGLA